ncbi:calnexin [Harmonia axyridis]|uniref:calnexin n=1 Tax=Harmonia axyridis TaxID=115357 RepID=UPI001E276193|nr:calnexin [Harmonia axyridis]XP_045478979.1 calnexin [Harmonia axyridis]
MKTLSIILGLLLVLSSTSANTDDDEAIVETVQDESPKPSVDIPYKSPEIQQKNKVYFAEHFDDPAKVDKTWVRSEAKKEDISEDIAKYDGVWKVEKPQREGLVGDLGLVLKTHAKHAAISSVLSRPFVFKDKPLIVQYEVTLQDGQQCGGAYLKLLSKTSQSPNLKQFHDKTPYTIMFGPDKCGGDFKLHFIFNHRNPLNGSLEEKHCKKPDQRLEDIINDKNPHLYTLILKPDNTFEILIDNKVVNSGHLLDDFTPAVNPPAEIDDVTDKKPEDWDEREKIPDPTATKPDDWDEEAPAQIIDESATKPSGWLDNEQPHIPDPDAKKPSDWDTEMDGEWEPPLIDNPACTSAPGCGAWEPPMINNPLFKGKWKAPLIDNPNYKGKWRPKLIPNPDFFEDKNPFKMTTVEAVGFELWSMSRDILFDNIIITEELSIAQEWAAETFEKKRQKIAKDSESVIDKLASLTVDYPILWGVYILALGIPVVLILYCLFKPSTTAKKEKEDLQRQAEKKKTDELTEDVEEENEEVGAAAEQEEGEQDAEEEVEDESSSTSEKPQEENARKRKVRKE